jgi:uncharacterized protein (DUF1330 family)
MPAYVIFDVELLDPSLVEKYRSLAQATISQYGGRYIIRGGAIEPVEGGCLPKHIVRSTSSEAHRHRGIRDDGARTAMV